MPPYSRIRNSWLRLDNGIPDSFPCFLEMASGSTQRSGPGKYLPPQCIRCLLQSKCYSSASAGIPHVVIFYFMSIKVASGSGLQ